ncbi:MAG: NAD(P)H-hydrate dehydratase [Fimbriimonas sp.]
MWIATADRSKRVDERAEREFGLSAVVLMERAGMAVFDAVQEILPGTGRITVFCGKGKNGGDGFVVARLALERGYHIECLVAGEERDLCPEAAEQYRIAKLRGLEPIFFSDARWARKADCVGCRDLIVDALLGTGASHEVRGPVKTAIEAINESGVPVVSVDVPSGILCDTGEELGESVWALRTITFGMPKPFLFQGIGLEHSGYWSVADIGYPNVLLNEPTDARLVDRESVASLLPERLRASHKGENGHLLIVAGSQRFRGAASLSALGALHSGSGLVTVAGTREVCSAVASQIPEAILHPLSEENGVLCPEAYQEILNLQSRCHAAVFGPGLTHDDAVLELLSRVWEHWTKPAVIDADALNALSHGVRLPNCPAILTPHPGEMSRLMQCSTAEVQADRFQTVVQATESYRRTVLLKGPYSIVGDPNQPLMVNQTGNPGQASGGMGDVLAGVLGALLAQQLPTYHAACCGMFWHGLSADICAEEIGPIGYTATDVAKALPKARARIVAS